MKKKKYNRDWFTSTRLEQRILLPFYFAALIILACLIYFDYLLLFHPLFFDNIITAELTRKYPSLIDVKSQLMTLAWLVTFAFLFLIYWAHKVTNRILGPHERVIRELDEILAGKRRQELKVRPGDVLFEPLLHRINKLVSRWIY